MLDRLQEMEDESAKLSNTPAAIVFDHIVTERIREPEGWKEEFGLYRGQAFGLGHSIDQLSLLRPRIKHPKVKNLYRVGASTRPGNGVPLVMVGARLTSEAVLRDVKSK